MRKMLLRIGVGVLLVFGAEAGLAAAMAPSRSIDFRALGLWLTVTGAFILVGSSLALLGSTTHASSSSIGPLSRMGGRSLPGGGVTPGGSLGVLVSSGTRSLWDFSRSPGLHAAPSRAIVPIGVGGVLFVLGVLLALV